MVSEERLHQEQMKVLFITVVAAIMESRETIGFFGLTKEQDQDILMSKVEGKAEVRKWIHFSSLEIDKVTEVK